MKYMSVTRLRSGISVASEVMIQAPLKASLIVVQDASPHWSMERSLLF